MDVYNILNKGAQNRPTPVYSKIRFEIYNLREAFIWFIIWLDLLLVHLQKEKRKKESSRIMEVSNRVQFFDKIQPSRHKLYIPDLIHEACYENVRVEIIKNPKGLNLTFEP
jgi:hypothetical protein